MLNSIFETRTQKDGLYKINLTIDEKEYFSVYEDVTEENAKEILDNHLLYRQDDGRADNIQIKHNKNEHLVTITADLHYTGNEKTEDMYNTHDYIREKGEMRVY